MSVHLNANESGSRGKLDVDQVSLLNQAVHSFNGTALKFERHYQHLRKRVQYLDSELRLKNEALQRSLQEKQNAKSHLSNIVESLDTGVVVIDLQGRITNFNPAAENITGLMSERVIGQRFDAIFGSGFFQNSDFDFKSLRDIQGSTGIETEICHKGKCTTYVTLSISPLKDTQEARTGTVLTIQDVTRIKRLEEQANRASRLIAMGEMAAQIAHEIRNPLGSIELFAGILREDLEHNKESKALAEYISNGVRSINNIISNLLLFIRPQQKAEFRLVDVHEILSDSLFFSSHLIKSNNNIEVLRNYSSRPLMVHGDSELLKQVALNLLLNAIQAMPHGGKLTISTKKVNGRKKDQNLAEIKFVDTGLGISRKDMPRIFDPFFSTKKRGTGLGLAIVHNIIGLHCGTINISSEEMEGTECAVCLPLGDS